MDDYENAEEVLEEYEPGELEGEPVEDAYDQYDTDEELVETAREQKEKPIERAKKLVRIGVSKAKEGVGQASSAMVKIGGEAIKQYQTDLTKKKRTRKSAGKGGGALALFMPTTSNAPPVGGNMFYAPPAAPPAPRRRTKAAARRAMPDPAFAMLGISTHRTANTPSFDLFGTQGQGNSLAFEMLGISQPRAKRRKPRKSKKKTRRRKK